MDLFASVSGDKMRPDRERSNSRVLSPRFAPVMPDKIEVKAASLL